MKTRFLAAVSLLALAAGCGGPPDGVDAAAAAQPAVADASAPLIVGHGHMMRKKNATPVLHAVGPQLNYWGGHVLSHVKVYAVYWGGNVDSTTRSKIPAWLTGVTNSAYMDWLLEYDTNIQTAGGGPGTNQQIGRGSYGGAVKIDPSVTGSFIDDSQIAQEIDSQISAGHLATPDADTMYMTFFPPNTQISLQGASSCQDFCAYHNTFVRGGKSVVYGVIPDFGPGSGCDQGCGFNANMFDNIASGVSHEMIEAVTDAEIGLVTGGDAPPMAWYDDNYGEIGDICETQPDGHIGTFTVQTEWSNQRQACITDDPSIPTPTPTPGTGGGGHHSHGLLGDLPGGCGCNLVAEGGARAGEGWIALAGLVGLTVVLRRRR